MKTEFIEISETQKRLVVEVPSAMVDAEIERLTRDYGRAARFSGFRKGKVPGSVVRQRYRSQILNDVARELIPRAIDEALRERGVEPIETPDVRDVNVEEGQPLTFTAAFETLPPIDPGDYTGLLLRKSPILVTDQDVDPAIEQLRRRAARFEAVEGDPIGRGLTAVLDLDRRVLEATSASDSNAAPGAPEHLEGVNVEIGESTNPPGLDEELIGLQVGAEKAFRLRYPSDYGLTELAGSEVEYSVKVTAIKRRVLPEIDDEFAKDLGDFGSLDELRSRIREDLVRRGEDEGRRQLRSDLMKQLSERVGTEVPEVLVTREAERRVHDFARQLREQQIDPSKTDIDWHELRERQREPALEAVRGVLVLDEVARREGVRVTEKEIAEEIARYAERTGQAAAALRARMEKDGALERLAAGLRREKAIDFLMSHARIVTA